MKKCLQKLSFITTLLFISVQTFSQPAIGLQTIATGFEQPVDIVNAGDGRLFIVEQTGYIRILKEDGTKSLFLNIDSKVKTSGEQGLLGLAFHPDYLTNGYFYVNYINNAGNTRISRFSVDPTNPDVANAASEVILLNIAQPYTNHNGGDLKFGPDGYLYIGMGDGGSGGDPENRAQDITSQLLGKMLRIDVNSGTLYSSPPTNPFVGITGDDEIWAYGLRNPWRFSFDKATGDLWIADVGQDAWEEIDYQPASSTGGENYGWRCYEGNHEYNTSLCTIPGSYTFPIFEYEHSFETGGHAVTGGFVYRGTEFPGMVGNYIMCDYISGNFWSIKPDGAGGWNTNFISALQTDISSFGEGYNGELYACNLSTGEIYHVIDENCGPVWGVNVTAITASSATISWQNVGSPNYKVTYKTAGSAAVTVATAGTSVNLTGLSASKTYTYIIKNKCPGIAGINTKTGTFTTLPMREGINLVNTAEPALFPNYGNGIFYVQNNFNGYSIELFDMSGQNILYQNIAGQSQIDLSALSSGIYIAKFISGDAIIKTQKIIITR